MSNCLYPSIHITQPDWNSTIKDKLWQAFKHTGKLSLNSQWGGISLALGTLLACRVSSCKLESDVLWVELVALSGLLLGHCAWHMESWLDFHPFPSLADCDILLHADHISSHESFHWSFECKNTLSRKKKPIGRMEAPMGENTAKSKFHMACSVSWPNDT